MLSITFAQNVELLSLIIVGTHYNKSENPLQKILISMLVKLQR